MAEGPQLPELGAKRPQPVQLGSYRLLKPLGSGGMSSVYHAVHTESGHEVALKILPRSLAKNPAMLQRFLREARSSESLQHPNIVEIFDRGSEAGLYYLALEFVPGGDLQERVKKDGPMPANQAIEIIRQVSEGLRYAATQGVIHRDIKPANLLFTPEGQVKITDLGLALQAEEDDERVTRDGTTVGTVDFMAPEQARDSRATTIRSDIYSLGCTFYYLLTGKPPFPDGNVPERLRKHAYDPIPDIRRVRPDLPEALSRLLQKLLAKKPENRFEDYGLLLQGLNDLPAIAATGLPVVLVDESVESTPISPAKSPTALSPGSLRDLSSAPGTELGDEFHPKLPDQGDHSLRNLLQSSGGAGDERSNRSQASSLENRLKAAGSAGTLRPLPEEMGEIPLAPFREERSSAELPPAAPRRAPIEKSRPPARAERAGRTERRVVEPIELGEEQILEPEAAVSIPTGFVRPAPPSGNAPVSAKNLSKTALQWAIGLAVLVMAWAGIQGLLARSQKTDEPVAQAVNPVTDAVPAGVPKAEGGMFWIPGDAAAQTNIATTQAWNEPTDPLAAAEQARPLDAQAVTSLGLEEVVKDSLLRWPGPVTKVRRAVSDRGRGILESVRRGLDQVAGTLELADDGPFFEQDWRINGSPRAIRAADGARSTLVIEAPRLPSVQSRPAVFQLDGKVLILQGIDLVVRASDLPANQTALFLCTGGELVLRDCTVTVVGQREAPLAVFQLGQAGVSAGADTVTKLRLERSLVRMSGGTPIRLAEGAASVALIDSLVLAGPQPIFGLGGGRDSARTVDLVRSLVVSEGPLVELAGATAGAGARPSEFRVLDCTMVHLAGSPPPCLIVDRQVPGQARSDGLGIVWKGSGNAYSGWPTPETPAGSQGVGVRAAGPAALGSASDQAVVSLDAPLPQLVVDAWTEPDTLVTALGLRGGLYARVARPRSNLRAWAVEAFPLLSREPREAGAGAPAKQILTFDADDSRLNGDLGRYLAESVDVQTRNIRLEVRGNGRKWVTPFALRPGFSLEIVVAPTSAGGEPLLFVPRETAEGEALILVQDAELELVGVQFERDARSVLKHLIRVENGRLRLERCTLRAPMQVEPGGGNLIAFRTDGTRPMLGTGKRPECLGLRCLLMTGGRLIDASVGRGLVYLEQSTLVAGAALFQLNAEPVASRHFEADLQLARCTIVAERDVVRFGPWTGNGSGPARPWVLATRGCVFFDSFDRGPAPSTTVLLRSNAEALAGGALVWQSNRDAYAVSQFVTTGDIDHAPTSFPDLRRDWVNFWGDGHVLQPLEAKGLVKLGRERLRPGVVEPKDVVVRAVNPRGQAPELGADASVIESEVPMTKPTLPASDPAKARSR